MPKTITYEFYSEQEIGVNLFGIVNSNLEYSFYTTIADAKYQYPSVIAFAGARFSRSDLSIPELLKEIMKGKKGAQERLADIFRNYGHASVGDMALQFAYIQNIPLISGFFFFYTTSVGAGQERSTRYQNYSKSTLMPLKTFFHDSLPKNFTELENAYNDLGEFALNSYISTAKILNDSYKSAYSMGDEKISKSALNSRVFESARYFLLGGFRTSLAYITSAREWSRIITDFKTRDGVIYADIGKQLEGLFTPPEVISDSFQFVPEAPDLIRHTEADFTIKDNLKALREYIEDNFSIESILEAEDKTGKFNDQEVIKVISNNSTEILLTQYIQAIYPAFSFLSILDFIKHISKTDKKKISKIIFAGHNNYIQMDNIGRMSSHAIIVRMSIGEARDLNRHRALGRYTSMFEFPSSYRDILKNGYSIPLFLRDNPKLVKEKEEFCKSMSEYFRRLEIFLKKLDKCNAQYDPEVVLMLLPLATNIQYILHGSPKEISYFTKQRVRPGGHINYREIAYQIAKRVSESDPLLEGLKIDNKPNSLSSEEFYDRS